ncbi:MAG: hypothetical protein ACK2T7_09135, partial [Anaerolineales bacterium]
NLSNYFMEGGPFQSEIEGQNYILASYEFNQSLIKLLESIEVFDFGSSAGMYCGPSPIAIHLFTDPVLKEYLDP